MAYQSLYRKYRPQTFADVMGQGHVVRTLQNAIVSGRVAHGYLFTGTRGTAKTTIARLLAKALNCDSSDRPVAEPCNQCGACKAITAGASIDVIEMDAASHRGVADIEEVRKSVGYGPMELRYKVFIIDEAHQLSNDAKDAFLKTLEEPPANVVFILATTEPQAIPITIRSRCQQFDFKRGSLAEIATRLKYVLEAEGVTYTSDAINLVARGAEGSYRDSLSLLEQVLAFAPTHVSAEAVNTVLGSLNAEMLSQVVAAVAQRNAPVALALAGELLDAGKEARTLMRTLAAHFRDLMLVHIGGQAATTELTPDEVKRLQHEASLFTPQQMIKAIDILNEAQGETRWNNQHRLLVELTFLKLMTIGDAVSAPLPTAPIVFSSAPATPITAPVSAAPQTAPTPTPAPAAAIPTRRPR
jgi:DNA polymerase III subunit gamma/tau